MENKNKSLRKEERREALNFGEEKKFEGKQRKVDGGGGNITAIIEADNVNKSVDGRKSVIFI